jgi:hypothetical protein
MMKLKFFRKRDTRRQLLCLLCILCCSWTVLAQKRISGTVVDGVNDEPICRAFYRVDTSALRKIA